MDICLRRARGLRSIVKTFSIPQADNVGAVFHYVPLHYSTAGTPLRTRARRSSGMRRRIAAFDKGLPSGWALSEAQQQRVCEGLGAAVRA